MEQQSKQTFLVYCYMLVVEIFTKVYNFGGNFLLVASHFKMFLFFSIRLLSVLLGHSVFSSPQQRPITSDLEGFSIPDFIHYIYFPILILEKEVTSHYKMYEILTLLVHVYHFYQQLWYFQVSLWKHYLCLFNCTYRHIWLKEFVSNTRLLLILIAQVIWYSVFIQCLALWHVKQAARLK